MDGRDPVSAFIVPVVSSPGGACVVICEKSILTKSSCFGRTFSGTKSAKVLN